MAKLGVGPSPLGSGTIPHSILEVAAAGGVEYKIEDPVQRLIHTIGGGFFNEPQYYTDKNGVDSAGLHQEAAQIINTMKEVGMHDPHALMCILSWARNDLRLRTTVEVGTAIAATLPDTKHLLTVYSKHIIKRADSIRMIFAAYRHLFSTTSTGKRKKGTVPNQLAKMLGNAFAAASPYELMKWDGVAPSFKDVLIMIRNKTHAIQNDVFRYWVNREVGKELPAAYQHRAAFNKAKTFQEALDHASVADITWENLLSRASNPVEKRQAWTWLIRHDKLPYMAMLRNLRNIIAYKDDEHGLLTKVAERISTTDPEKHKQYPYRFLAAYNEIEGIAPQIIRTAVASAMDSSTALLQQLPGNTAILVDVSGSMYSLLSDKSKMRIVDAASCLAACLVKCSADADIYPFATNYAHLLSTGLDSCITISKQIKSIKRIGCGTEPWKVMDYFVKARKNYTRIVIISDMCCYGTGYYYGDDSALPALLEKYQRLYRGAYLHSINMSGQSQGSQADPNNKHVNLLSGFSEKLIENIAAFETEQEGGGSGKVSKTIPTIEQIKEKYLCQV